MNNAYAQDKKPDFVLPAPGGATGNADAATQVGGGTPSIPLSPMVPATNNTKGMLIGMGALLVLMVVFFFIRGAWANSLVAKKVPPSKANASGWWLFLLLTIVSVGVILYVVSPGIVNLIFLGAMGVLALFALIMMIVSSSR